MMTDLPPPEIHNRGRGPEIKGTRITVFDVMDYCGKYSPAWIAQLFSLPVPHVEEAIRYIDEHREELAPQYQEMVERAARGNPPEIQAKLDAAHARFLARLDETQRRRIEELFRDGSDNGR